MRKTIIKLGIIFLVLSAGYFVWLKVYNEPSRVACTMEAKLCPDGSAVGRTGPSCEFAACPGYALNLEYKNTDYGFSVALPDNWTGYTVSIDRWTGYAVNDQLGEAPYTTGPVVSIHNPKWTKELMYQDIPVMVFTLSQWSDLLAEKFHIGAAPVGPSEFG